MRFVSALGPVLLPLLLSTAVAVPQPAAGPPPPSCIVPQVIFESLDKPFTLAALVPGPSPSTSQRSIPARLDPSIPTKSTASSLIISNARIASTQFQLKDKKLIAAGFRARLLPTTLQFPPPLQGFVFGGNTPTSPLNFSASYDCDSTGQIYLRLGIDRGFSELPMYRVLESKSVANFKPSSQFGRLRCKKGCGRGNGINPAYGVRR